MRSRSQPSREVSDPEAQQESTQRDAIARGRAPRQAAERACVLGLVVRDGVHLALLALLALIIAKLESPWFAVAFLVVESDRGLASRVMRRLAEFVRRIAD